MLSPGGQEVTSPLRAACQAYLFDGTDGWDVVGLSAPLVITVVLSTFRHVPQVLAAPEVLLLVTDPSAKGANQRAIFFFPSSSSVFVVLFWWQICSQLSTINNVFIYGNGRLLKPDCGSCCRDNGVLAGDRLASLTYAPLSTCTELHLSGKFLSLSLGQSQVRSSRLPAKFRCSKRVTWPERNTSL